MMRRFRDFINNIFKKDKTLILEVPTRYHSVASRDEMIEQLIIFLEQHTLIN